MQEITFPGLPTPINTALCCCGHLNRPEQYHGQLTRVVWLYEDDHQNQVRRVIKVFAPVTPAGRVRQKGTTYVDVLTLKGWDDGLQMWGGEGEETQNLGLDPADAGPLLKSIESLVTSSMEQFRNSSHWYRKAA
ncbi:TPA: hypothetical protein NIA45_004717 [Pseudomonas aeruginosa]|nr:hypothetical protein [Pseudomonas aeruginosa]